MRVRAARRHEGDGAAALRVVRGGIRAWPLTYRLHFSGDPLRGQAHLARLFSDGLPAGTVGPDGDDSHHCRCQRRPEQHQKRQQAPVAAPVVPGYARRRVLASAVRLRVVAVVHGSAAPAARRSAAGPGGRRRAGCP